jgi:hypothetical protein
MRFIAAVDAVVMIGNMHMTPDQDAIAENNAVSAPDVNVVGEIDSVPDGNCGRERLRAVTVDGMDEDPVASPQRAN